MENMTFRDVNESDLKLFWILSEVLLHSNKQPNLRLTVTKVNGKGICVIPSSASLFSVRCAVKFLKNRISALNKQTAYSKDLTSNANAIVLFDDKCKAVILLLSLPKLDRIQFQVITANKKKIDGKNSGRGSFESIEENVVTSETIHNIINSPGSEVTLQTLCQSMLKLHLNSIDLLLSPVGIGRWMKTKEFVPGGSGKAAVADSTTLMFVVLGWSGGNPAPSIEMYDGNTQKWYFYMEESPIMRAYHGVSLLGGHLYIVGGFNGYTCLQTTTCLNVQSREWSRKHPMFMPRCYLFTLVHRGEIYAIGGHNGERRLKTCEKYDPKTNRWSHICEMMYRRSDAAGAELNGKILVCGGFDGFQFHSTTEIYDPVTNQWTLVGRSLHPRSGHCMINFEGQAFALGGFDGVTRLREVEKFNEETGQWEHSVPMLEGRSNFCTAVFQEEIYVMGGFDGNGTMSSVEKFGKTLTEWHIAPSLNLHRSATGACVMNNSGSATACEINELAPVASTYTEESSP